MRIVRIVVCAILFTIMSAPANAHWRASGWSAWRGSGHHGCRSRGLCPPSARWRRAPLGSFDAPPWREISSGQDFHDFEGRDAKGRYQRSWAARQVFEYGNPCPSTGLPYGACPGYVVDHIVALKRGGADDPSNMQWQTVEDAKAKDKVE